MAVQAKKKLYLMLGIIALLLAVYLVASHRGADPDIPELATWSGHVDEIVIGRPAGPVRIYRQDDRWLIGNEAYPADDAAIDRMEKTLKDLTITQLTTRAPHYEHFDLTPDKAIEVKARKGGRIVRSLLIGKKSDKTTHTFVRVGERPEIFKAAGYFDSDFGRPVDALRDHRVVDIKAEEIVSVTIRHKGKTLTFAKERVATAQGGDTKAEPEAWVCREHRDIALHEVKMQNLLKSFNPLKSRGFSAADAKKLTGPLCTVVIAEKSHATELNFYRGEGEHAVLAVSSASPYVFEVAKYIVEGYCKDINEFRR